ncbi:hypothetical protein [Corynebacterium sp. c8Ua_99]
MTWSAKAFGTPLDLGPWEFDFHPGMSGTSWGEWRLGVPADL